MIFHFLISFVDENHESKQNSPRWDAAFCGVTFGVILYAYVPFLCPIEIQRIMGRVMGTTIVTGDSGLADFGM